MKLGQVKLADQVLTNLAWGYKDDTMIGESLFPKVVVDKESDKIAKFGKESFRLYNADRARNASLNTTHGVGATTVSYTLKNYQLEVSEESKLISEASYNLLNQMTKNVTVAVQRKMEYDIATLAQSTASYASGHSVTLTTDYLNESDIDPIQYILNQCEIVYSKIGVMPNTMVLSQKVWKALRHHPKIKAYFSSVESQVITIKKLSELTEIPNIQIGASRYTESDGTFASIWTNSIILSYTAPAQGGLDRTVYDPAFGFLLVQKGYPIISKYEDESATFTKVNSSTYALPLVVGSESAFLVKNPIDPAVYSA